MSINTCYYYLIIMEYMSYILLNYDTDHLARRDIIISGIVNKSIVLLCESEGRQTLISQWLKEDVIMIKAWH